jgi:hypothetical protein
LQPCIIIRIIKMIQQAIDNMDENVIRRCWVKTYILPAPQQAKANSNVDRPSSNLSSDEDIDVELGFIVESFDLAKLGERDISAKEVINIDSMEPIDERYIIDHEIVIQVLKEGNNEPINNMESNHSPPLLATTHAAIRILQDYTNCEGKENLLRIIEQLKQIMPSEPKQISIMNFFAPK